MTHHPLSPAVLADLSRHLLVRQSVLRAELQALAHANLAEQVDPVADFKDLAGEQLEQSMDDETAARASRELAEVGAALLRLRQGRYGVCLSCGDPIPEQRLLAIPTAAFCAGCQSLHEHSARPASGLALAAGR